MVTENVFTKAAKIPAKKTSKNPNIIDHRVPTEGLEDYAIVDFALKYIETLKDIRAAKLKDFMRTEFLRAGARSKTKPANMRGFEGAAEASLELRKRSEASALDDTQAELLETLGITFGTIVDKDETYILNPKYKDDDKIKAKIAAFAEKAGLPDDLLLYQEGKTRRVVTTDTEAALYNLTDNQMKLVFDVIQVLAIKPKVDPEKLNKEEVFKRLGVLAGFVTDDQVKEYQKKKYTPRS